MNKPYIGKPSPRLLEELLGGDFGKISPEVIVGPGPGLDAAVINIGKGRVMAIAEDPIFPAPKLPLEIMGYFTVHIGASDVAVTGICPRYMTYTLLLPRSCSPEEARVLISSISETAKKLGITIVGGHTGWYDAVTIPTVGGVTVWGFAEQDNWVSPGGAKDGDIILLTKGPSIEAAALLAVLYKERLKGKVESFMLEKACRRVEQISVVKDALTAFKAGGVHAMHDATEGGVLGGLWEMQAASGIKLQADLDKIAVPEDILSIAKALNFDPWKAISEGTLLIAAEPKEVEKLKFKLCETGIETYILGSFSASLKVNSLCRNGQVMELPEPDVDPFWDLFFAGLAQT